MGDPELDHQYLAIDRFHLNEKAAVAFVLSYVSRLVPKKTAAELKRSSFKFGEGKSVSFASLMREARELGTVHQLWHHMDSRYEQYFPPGMGMEVSAGLKISINYAGISKEVEGPARLFPIEAELTNDILAFRQDACSAKKMTQIGRYYRAYVFACTALVEAFLSRPVHLNSDLKTKDEKIRRLSEPCKFDERIELWTSVFCDKPLSVLKGTTGWGHLQELRRERNMMLHGAEVAMGIGLADLPNMLNKVREGVGGFLATLRSMQGCKPLPFIQRLQTAPRVKYIPKK